MRNELLEPDRMKAIQEELAGFFLDHVIHKDRECHVEVDMNLDVRDCKRCYIVYV